MVLDFAKDQVGVVSYTGFRRMPNLELAARTFEGQDADIEALSRRFGSAHSVGRIGEPKKVADLVAFLTSDKAGFFTGSDHRIDGGLLPDIGVN